MKKVLLACVLSLGTVAVLQAQDSTATQPATQSDNYQTPAQQTPSQDANATSSKDEIAPADLPAAITDKLKGQDYAGWTVAKAHRKAKDGKNMYAVELKNGSETKKIKFDEQGNVLKEKD